MRKHLVPLFAAFTLPAAATHAQGPNPSNLWLVDLHWTGNRLSVGTPVKLTHDEGNNSQPSFTPDGKAVLFSATRDTGSNARSNIYRIDLATRTETRVTHTAENENSPVMNERGEYIAVRWNPATLFKEFGPWIYSADGTPKQAVLRAPDTTGYFTPLANGDYALTRPKSRTFTLGIFDVKTGTITDVDSGLPALPAQRIPGERALSYIRIDTANAHHEIRRVDLATHTTSTLAPALTGRTAHSWSASHKTMLMGKGNVLYARTVGVDNDWRIVATFDNAELRNISAYVVSNKGDQLILTSAKRAALATLLRDSLEAGHSASDIAQYVMQLQSSGRFAEYDVTENSLGGLGEERVQKRYPADGVAVQTIATSLFPKSYRAFARLGDAQRSAGDSITAILSYRKSLELNPRITDAERNAADAVMKKIGGSASNATLQLRGLQKPPNVAIRYRCCTKSQRIKVLSA